jgi:hypothetical protein
MSDQEHTKGPWDVIPVFILQPDQESIHFSEYRIREFGGGADYVQRPRAEAEANAPTKSGLIKALPVTVFIRQMRMKG